MLSVLTVSIFRVPRRIQCRNTHEDHLCVRPKHIESIPRDFWRPIYTFHPERSLVSTVTKHFPISPMPLEGIVWRRAASTRRKQTWAWLPPVPRKIGSYCGFRVPPPVSVVFPSSLPSPAPSKAQRSSKKKLYNPPPPFHFRFVA